MMNLNDLYYLMNNQRAMNRARANEMYPLDGDVNIEKVINHPVSKTLWALIQKGLQNNSISKKLPEFYPQFLQMCQSEQEKSVCAKLIKPSETIVECYDCRMDSSCIICMDCFKNGNHKGHRVMFKSAGGGCCDCGDPQAWKEQGFCSKHTGKAKQIQIPPQEQTISNQILTQLFFLYSWMKITNNNGVNEFFKAFQYFLKQMVKRGLKGMKFISLFLNQSLPKKMALSKKLPEKIFQQILNLNFLTGVEFQEWQNLFIEMFPYYPFKQQLLANYISCYSTVYAGENQLAQSISCQIMTSYKLVEDYAESKFAVPISVNTGEKLSSVCHLTKMMIWDLNRINSLTGEASEKYWKMQINHGIINLFGYYQSLQALARKQRNAALEVEEKEKKKKEKTAKKNKLIPQFLSRMMGEEEEEELSDEDNADKSFSLIEFLIRHNRIIECEYNVIEQILNILPVISKNEQTMLQLIKDIFYLIIKEINRGDDLLIFRPYERLLGIVLFYYARQTPFVLSSPKIRQTIRTAVNLNQQDWDKYLTLIQKRMLQTFGFFSHLQTCEAFGYHTSFYTYIVLYAAKYCLLGHADILILRELIFLGAPEMIIDFADIAKLDRLEPPNIWNLRSFSGLITELGMLYTGSFSEIYISFHPEKATPPAWLGEQAKRVLKKFITAQGGSCSLQKVGQFSNSLLFKKDEDLKIYLKELCTFNKDKKIFELLPANYDKEPINYKDFMLRMKVNNKIEDILHPQLTLQFMDKSNKMLFTYLWNKANIESFCQILLMLYEGILKSNDKQQMLQYLALPCRLEYFLKANDVLTNFYTSLSELLATFEVPIDVRKTLGVLSNCLSPIIEEPEILDTKINQQKQQMRLKKLKKLEQLKKRNTQNVQKIKEKHEIVTMEEEISANHCVICKKQDGDLVWVARMSIRNLQKVLQFGSGTLTLSFTSCYHAFDHQCLQKSSIKRSTHEFYFRCPVCRSLGNVFFSISNSQTSSFQASFDRIMHVAQTMREYVSFDIYQEMIKSFYHLVLLSSHEAEYVKRKRAQLYKQIFKMFCHPKMKNQIQSLLKKLQSSQIALQPKMHLSKQSLNLKEAVVQEQDMEEEWIMDSDDEEFVNYAQRIDIMAEGYKMEEMEAKKMMKKEQQEIQEQAKSKKIKNQKPSPLFYYAIKRILSKALKVIEQNKKMIVEGQPEPQEKISLEQKEVKEEENQNQMKQQNQLATYVPQPWAVAIIDQLLDETKLEKNNQEHLPQKSIKLIDLPQKFYWDLSESTCNSCKKVCSDLFICLLCGWKGCLNKCRKGGLKNHTKKLHGQNGAFWRLKDANSYIISPGQLNKVGCLYTNEWGEQFKQQEDWNNYTLQTSILEKVKKMFLKNE